MSEKINLNQLGVIYTVLNKDTEEVSKIRVIDSREIYQIVRKVKSQQGIPHKKEMKEALSGLTGFVKSPFHVTWYAATQDTYKVENAVSAAKKEGNKTVIIELLPDLELDTGYNIS